MGSGPAHRWCAATAGLSPCFQGMHLQGSYCPILHFQQTLNKLRVCSSHEEFSNFSGKTLKRSNSMQNI